MSAPGASSAPLANPSTAGCRRFPAKGGSRNTRSKGGPLAWLRSQARVSAWMMVAPLAPRSALDAASWAMALASRSIITASRAPRESASKPSAPEPAKASRQRLPTTSGASQLNRVSRIRAPAAASGGEGRQPVGAGFGYARPGGSQPGRGGGAGPPPPPLAGDDAQLVAGASRAG